MTRVQRLASVAATVLGISYFVLVHAAAVTHRSSLAVIALAMLAAAVLLPGLVALNVIAWIAALVVTPLLYWLYQHDLAQLPLYAAPVLITLFLAWGFGRTLVKGRTPLIFRFVRLMHGPDEVLDPRIERYARQLTGAWTMLFIVMALVNLLLALFATPDGLLLAAGVTPPVAVPQAVWSAFANFINYAIVGLFFVVEFAWRRVRFPDQPYRGFFDFMRRLAAIGPQAKAALRDDPPA